MRLTETLKSIDNFTENNLHINFNAFNSNHTAEILAFKGLEIKLKDEAVKCVLRCLTKIIDS